MTRSGNSNESRDEQLKQLAEHAACLPDDSLLALLELLRSWPRRENPVMAPVSDKGGDLNNEGSEAIDDQSHDQDACHPGQQLATTKIESVDCAQNRLQALDWSKQVPQPVRQAFAEVLLQDLDRIPGVEQRILAAAKAIAAKTVGEFRHLEESQIRALLLAVRAIRAALLKRAPLGASLVRLMEDREDQALGVLACRRQATSTSSSMADSAERISAWARRLLREDPVIGDWTNRLPDLIELAVPASLRNQIVYCSNPIQRIDEAARVLLEMEPPAEAELYGDALADGRAVALWHVWRTGVQIEWEPGIKPFWYHLLEQGRESLARRVESVASGIDDHRSYHEADAWATGVPGVVGRALPKALHAEISLYQEARDRVLASANHLICGLRGDETRRFVRSLGVDEIRAIWAVDHALAGIRPYGVGVAAKFQCLRAALRAQLAELLEVETLPLPAGCTRPIRLPPPRVPAEFRAILLVSEIEALSTHTDADDWLACAGNMLGLEVETEGVPMRYRARPDAWYMAIDCFVELAKAFGAGAGLSQVSEAVRQQARQKDFEQIRHERLRETLQAISAGEWRQIGPLKAVGYRVDAINPVPPIVRHQILRDLLDLDLEFLTGIDGQIHLLAGGPRSRRRKAWILDYLRTFITLHRSRPNYNAAVDKWEADLAWLQRQRTD